MIQKIDHSEVYESNHGWLQSKFLFSFADYYDPKNVSWGRLRVFNDDTIKGGSGFDAHPHNTMEIVTIVHSGELTHHDSIGNTRTIGKGAVQRMSAGTGVLHSEMNHGADPVSLYQLWFLPKEKGTAPSYEEKYYKEEKGLTLLVSPDGSEDSVSIGSQVRIWKGSFTEGERLTIPLLLDRYYLIYVQSGEITAQDIVCGKGDQMRIHEEKILALLCMTETTFFLIEA